MKNKEKKIIYLIVFIIIGIVLFYNFYKRKYDIGDSFNSVKINSENDLNNYLGYIKTYMKPKKLANFVNYNDLHLSDFTDKATGYTILDEMEYEAYDRLFNSLFDRKREKFDDCPVTSNFKNKFSTNLFKCFNLYNSEDGSASCSIDREELRLDITEAGNFEVGEPGYIFYHHFHYTLDEEGNVDDVIFDYI